MRGCASKACSHQLELLQDKTPLSKRCSKCSTTQPLAEFNLKDKLRARVCADCRSCQRAISRKHYRENLERYYDRRRIHRTRYIADNKGRLSFILEQNSCVDCGHRNPIVLDFDHVRALKSHNISELVGWGTRWARIEEEIEKCEIRCVNCHRRRTVERAHTAFNRAVAQPGRALALGARGRRFKSSPPEISKKLQLLGTEEGWKRCPRCDLDLPLSSFRPRVSGGAQSYRRPCERSYNRHYYRTKDVPKQSQRVAMNAVAYRQRNQRKLFEYLMAHPCVDCGESDPVVLEFDHVLGGKWGP